MLLTLLLLHLLLRLFLSFLKKLKTCSFIYPFLLKLFPLLLDGFTVVLDLAMDIHLTSLAHPPIVSYETFIAAHAASPTLGLN
jgi:hypothetical protein